VPNVTGVAVFGVVCHRCFPYFRVFRRPPFSLLESALAAGGQLYNRLFRHVLDRRLFIDS